MQQLSTHCVVAVKEYSKFLLASMVHLYQGLHGAIFAGLLLGVRGVTLDFKNLSGIPHISVDGSHNFDVLTSVIPRSRMVQLMSVLPLIQRAASAKKTTPNQPLLTQFQDISALNCGLGVGFEAGLQRFLKECLERDPLSYFFNFVSSMKKAIKSPKCMKPSFIAEILFLLLDEPSAIAEYVVGEGGEMVTVNGVSIDSSSVRKLGMCLLFFVYSSFYFLT
jgi:hypothetical protein